MFWNFFVSSSVSNAFLPLSCRYQMLDYRIPQAVRETVGGPERQNAKERCCLILVFCLQ